MDKKLNIKNRNSGVLECILLLSAAVLTISSFSLYSSHKTAVKEAEEQYEQEQRDAIVDSMPFYDPSTYVERNDPAAIPSEELSSLMLSSSFKLSDFNIDPIKYADLYDEFSLSFSMEDDQGVKIMYGDNLSNDCSILELVVLLPNTKENREKIAEKYVTLEKELEEDPSKGTVTKSENSDGFIADLSGAYVGVSFHEDENVIRISAQ